MKRDEVKKILDQIKYEKYSEDSFEELYNLSIRLPGGYILSINTRETDETGYVGFNLFNTDKDLLISDIIRFENLIIYIQRVQKRLGEE